MIVINNTAMNILKGQQEDNMMVDRGKNLTGHTLSQVILGLLCKNLTKRFILCNPKICVLKYKAKTKLWENTSNKIVMKDLQ